MAEIIIPHSLRVGEVFIVGLGFVLSTVAICAPVYTKLRIVRKFLLEDCKLYWSAISLLTSLLKQSRVLGWLIRT